MGPGQVEPRARLTATLLLDCSAPVLTTAMGQLDVNSLKSKIWSFTIVTKMNLFYPSLKQIHLNTEIPTTIEQSLFS